MEGQERSDDLRASRSWEVVHRMPAQADAAQGKLEDKQAQEGVSSSVEKIPEAKEGDVKPEGVTAAKEDHDWVLGDSEDPAVTELECFEGEAEVLQDSHKDTGLRFEEEDTCVHASKPSSDAVDAVEYDSASEGDPEASSLAGSDCEYAFVLDHPKMRLPDADKDIDTHPVKGRSMPQAQPSPTLSPLRSPQRALRSRSAPGRAPPVLQAARSGGRSPAQSPALPSPALSCTEKAHLKAVANDAEQSVCCGEMAALGAAAAAAAEEEAATDADTGPINTDCLGAQQAGGGGDAIVGQEMSVQTADEALSRHASGEYAYPNETLSCQCLSDGTDEAESGCSVQSSSLVQTAAAEIARQRRSQLDAVGVIPGGRAAFGAKLPTYGSCTAGDCAGAAGRQAQQEVQAERPVRAAMPELARPAAPDWARQRKRGVGGAGSGGASGLAPVAAKLLQRLQARPASAAQSEGRRAAPAAARGMEVWALAGSALERYDSLWHGSSGIMASQS